VEAGPAISTSSTHAYLPSIKGWFIGPVSIDSDPDFAWLKELQAPDRGWPRRNGSYSLIEVIRVGEGAAWSGWHEEIRTSGWSWTGGSIFTFTPGADFGPGSAAMALALNLSAGALNRFDGLTLLDTGSIASGGIRFDFNPLGTDTWLLVSKTLAWDGGGRPSGPIHITEGMSTVPIPGAAWLLGAGLAGLVAMRRARS
jgi:hypothetical protein